MKKLKQNSKRLDESQKKMNELMASIFKESTTQNERKEEQEVSTTDGTETSDVVSEIMCDVGKLAVGMAPASDTTPLAMPSEVVVSFVLVSDQLQWVASPVHGELSTEAGSFNRHYSAGYVHQFAFDPGVEDLMVVKFGSGSSSGYDYLPATVH